MLGHSQQRFMVWKSALAGLTALTKYLDDKILGFSDYRTVLYVIFFIKAFNIVSHNIQVGILQSGWMGN